MKKQGISLIVLVITIIVLAILAAAVIISLSNTNVIGQSEKTVLANDYAELASALSLKYTDLKVAAHIGEDATGAIVLADAITAYTDVIEDTYGFKSDDTLAKATDKATYTKERGTYTATFDITINADGSYTLSNSSVGLTEAEG